MNGNVRGISPSVAALHKALQIIEEFRTDYPRIQSQAICTFLVIAMEEGLTVTDLQHRLGFKALSSASNNIMILSEQARRGQSGTEPGYGLVEHRSDVEDQRRSRLYLTRKGARLANRVADIARGK